MVDLDLHNFNRKSFDMLLEEEAGKYSIYVIMAGRFENLEQQLRKLGGRVILVDHCQDSLRGSFSSVTQNFAMDVYDALVSGLPQLSKYRELVLVQSSPKEPLERYDGVQLFCKDYGFECGFLKSMEGFPIRPGVVYLTPEDREIVNIELAARAQGLKAGRDYGLVAFNEQVTNEILCGGLTTISTDFVQMGKTLVDLIKDKDIRTVHNPSKLILRNSL